MANSPPLPQIPPEIQQCILPNKDSSVTTFLKFRLPAAARTADGSFNQSQKLLSNLIPTITDIEDICAIPTPPLAIVNKLIKAPELSESQSIHAPELTTHRLPLWIISYWIQVFHLRPLKKKWLDAEEALHKQEHGKGHTIETKGLINRVYNALACISWAGNINGFSASISTDHLATYLTKDWFSDEHENQMLYLLKQEVSREKRDNGIDVCDTFFMKRLIDLLRDVGGSNRYATATNYAWLRERGQELATGVLDTMVTLANIGENHWIALIVDFKASRILYGDSMGGTIDEDIEKALTWWIGQHTGTQFTTSYLPITRQQDGHSCGILAWNALAAYLLPAKYLLADARVVADERLKMFLRVSDRHNEKVMCDYISKTLILKRN